MGVLSLIMVAAFFTTVFTDTLPTNDECGIQVDHKIQPYYRISTGTEAEYGEFPWMAALHYKKKINDFSAGTRCGGFVISDRFVLTAARCLHLDRYYLAEVWLGVRKISEVDTTDVNSARKFAIEEQIAHERYSAITKLNDIALLKLEKKINYSNFIRPICLPAASAAVPESGTMVMVAGWGQPMGHGHMSDHKLKVDVPVYRHDVCEEKLGYPIRAVQICAEGETLKGTCWGDEGGPVMYAHPKGFEKQWFSLGIISTITGCTLDGKPSIHTRVSSYIPWILDKVENTHP